MKKISIRLIAVFLLVSSTQILFGQEECLVLKPQISSKYEGECKNGLAHGKGTASGLDRYEGQFKKGLPNGVGTYLWSNGDKYVGEFFEGFRHGEGSFTFKSNDRDTTIAGRWDKDEYKGPIPEKPKVITAMSVDRYTFQKTSDIKNRVLINMYQNGTRNLGIENFIMVSSSGYETKLGESVGFDNVTFPVTIKVNYVTWNKLRGSQYSVVFEFRIFEPGDWAVDIHN
jgi:hypothetical protein